jgi:hypothetical protein
MNFCQSASLQGDVQNGLPLASCGKGIALGCSGRNLMLSLIVSFAWPYGFIDLYRNA